MITAKTKYYRIFIFSQTHTQRKSHCRSSILTNFADYNDSCKQRFLSTQPVDTRTRKCDFFIFDKHAQANGRIKNLVPMNALMPFPEKSRSPTKAGPHFREESSACDSIRDPILFSSSTSVLTFFRHILTHHSSSPKISNSRRNPSVRGVPFLLVLVRRRRTGIHQHRPLKSR